MAEGGNFTLDINDNITDNSIARNPLAPFSRVLNVEDTLAPSVDAVSINGARDRIYVQYSELMADPGATSAINLANYRTATTAGASQEALPSGSTITMNGNIERARWID